MTVDHGIQGIGMTSARTRDRLVRRLQDQGIRSKPVLEQIRSYNQDDCEALEYVVKAITTIVPKEGDSANVDLPPKVVQIESLNKSLWPFSYGKKEFAFPELAHITKCSSWDYQRDRVYVRTNKRIKAIAKRNIASNATRVVPARLRGHKSSGGGAEALLLGDAPGLRDYRHPRNRPAAPSRRAAELQAVDGAS